MSFAGQTGLLVVVRARQGRRLAGRHAGGTVSGRAMHRRAVAGSGSRSESVRELAAPEQRLFMTVEKIPLNAHFSRRRSHALGRLRASEVLIMGTCDTPVRADGRLWTHPGHRLPRYPLLIARSGRL